MKRRTGDTVKISGDYQYKALTQGHPIQRFWHYAKHLSIKRYLPPKPSDTVLDVGCGSGVVTSFLGEFGATVVGIDGNLDAIQFANQQFSHPNVKFQLGLVDENIQLDMLIDKIYCLEVIEHIYINQSKDMLKAFLKILKPGGQVFLTTPNYKSMWPIIEWLMDRLGLSPPLAEHQHVEFYDKRKLEKLCLELDFEIKLISTTCFIAPWLAPFSWSLAKKVNVLESRLPFYLGSILICVLVKPTQDDI
jgi:2-polyprenyl-3-methyl-5-hydroxy-6-metoxy-1,4-benzoquinol methylase